MWDLSHARSEDSTPVSDMATNVAGETQIRLRPTSWLRRDKEEPLSVWAISERKITQIRHASHSEQPARPLARRFSRVHSA
jgi:hypothetical protein